MQSIADPTWKRPSAWTTIGPPMLAKQKRRRATLKDVAERVGVHVSTVSRALSPRSRNLITADVRKKILLACEELQYRPNRAAYSLRTNRSLTVGVIIPDITNAIFPPIIRGIEDALSAREYVPIIGNTDAQEDREANLIETLTSRGVDGLIIASVRRHDDAVMTAADQGVHIVTVNRRLDDSEISSVVSDDEAGIRRMLGHLVSMGHRRIAHIGGPQTLSTGQVRYQAFKDSLAEFGLTDGDCPTCFAAAFSEDVGERCAEHILSGSANPTAFLCANDRLAIGALEALKHRRLRCPQDVSVTGFNDMPLVDRIDPPLTTVTIQQYNVGRRAAEILLDRILDSVGSEPRHEVLPVTLTIRESSAPPRR